MEKPYNKGVWKDILNILDETKVDLDNQLSRTDCVLNALSSILSLETDSGENKLEIQRIFQEELLDNYKLSKEQALEEYIYFKRYRKLLYSYK